MKIGVVTIAYKLAESTAKLLDSIQSFEHSIEIHLFLHSQQANVMDVCEGLKGTRPGAHYYPYGVNRGLSRSWNEGILNAYANGCDVVIVVNDDCIFGEFDVDLLAGYAIENPQFYMVGAMGFHEKNKRFENIAFSCFAINKIAIEQIGLFDENIFPIYFEDCDYGRRAELLDLEQGLCWATQVRHGGSETLHQGDEDYKRAHTQTFLGNQEYYLKKWGGLPGEEVYTTPFNQVYGLRIGADMRHAPYLPEHNRTNPHIEPYAGGPLKLDIGCGDQKKEGYLGVDPYIATDYQNPMWALPFKDNSALEIYSSHALEHVPLKLIVPTLTEWCRVLHPEGKITLLVPDLVWCVNKWLETKGNGWDMAILFGHQAHDGEFHKTGFTYELMLDYLAQAGLKIANFERIESHGQMTMSFECSK